MGIEYEGTDQAFFFFFFEASLGFFNILPSPVSSSVLWYDREDVSRSTVSVDNMTT